MINRLKEFYLNSSIRVKINLTIVGAAGIILIVLLTVVSLRSRSIVLGYAEKSTISTGKENAYKAIDFMNKKLSALKMLTSSFESQAGMGDLKFDLYKNTIEHIAKEDSDICAVWFIEDFKMNDTSNVQRYIYTTQAGIDKASMLQKVENELGYKYVRSTGETWVNDPIPVNGMWLTNIAVPLELDGKIVGVVGFLLNTEFFGKIVSEAMSDEDGICKIVTGNGLVAAHSDKENVGKVSDEGDKTQEVLERIKKNEQFSTYVYSNHFKGQSYKVYVPITFDGTKYTWSYCTIIPTSKVLHETHMLALITVLLIAIGLVVLVFATNVISRRLTRPIVQAAEQLQLIAEGRLAQAKAVDVQANDEIGSMVSALNVLTESQKHLAYFANEVGHGNLAVSIDAKNEQDIIGKAMVEMKQNLIDAREAEEKRRHEEEIYSWKVAGNARIHEAIRKENSSIKHLCDTIIQEVVSYAEIVQGGIFIVNEDQMDERYVELVSCVAYSRRKMQEKRLSIEEGLIGRCIYEKAPIILTEIPQDYLAITSGLGDRNPNFLAIIPLLNNEEMVGVLEVASFNVLEDYKVDYLTKAAESLASAISNVKINERTQRLLDQTKQYAEEMGAQEEELRQNMEEMQAAQEEMHRKTADYEETIAMLRKELDERS